VRRLLFLLPILAWAQAPTGSVHAVAVDHAGAVIPAAEIRTHSTEAPDRNIASITAQGFREAVRAIHPGQDLGDVVLDVWPFPIGVLTVGESTPPPPPTVLTVCEALEKRDRFDQMRVVIVGIFKSGLDETLRQDCPSQLVTGDIGSGQIGWMSAIALTRPTDPPESLRAEIEKKRAVILKSGPPGAQPRPERVVALYGRLVSPSGLTSIPCCTAPIEIQAAPARLVGLDERDFRVLR
jgi:hypothetical protein